MSERKEKESLRQRKRERKSGRKREREGVSQGERGNRENEASGHWGSRGALD